MSHFWHSEIRHFNEYDHERNTEYFNRFTSGKTRTNAEIVASLAADPSFQVHVPSS